MIENKTREIVERAWNKWGEWLKEYNIGSPGAYSYDVALVRLYTIVTGQMLAELAELFDSELDTQKAMLKQEVELYAKGFNSWHDRAKQLEKEIADLKMGIQNLTKQAFEDDEGLKKLSLVISLRDEEIAELQNRLRFEEEKRAELQKALLLYEKKVGDAFVDKAP